ncbi:MAG TPA: DUF4097 family beta strand repeat-containing protein [Steroidobacteraceae bacterium]|nr:DUF4097 family beta strand repeat-containing protein [Steroidobacteraceae bacterium]
MSIRNVCLAAATLAALAAPSLAGAETSPDGRPIMKHVNVAPDATVEVSNVQGRVEVATWDKNEVELVAELESPKDELEFEANERYVRISVERPNGKYRHDDDDEDDATLTLRVPKGIRLIADTVSADIAVSGLRGEQKLESVSGEVQTQAFDAPVRATSVSGEVSVVGNGGKATVSTENVSGSTTVGGIRGDYHGEVVSGEIRATVAAAQKIELNSVSGDIEIKAELTPTSRVNMESVSGTLTLKIKPPVNAEFDVESFSGDIDSCLGPKARSTSKYTPGSELNYTQGNGGARVEMQTLSGEISICDR